MKNNTVVVKHNKVIEASYKLTLSEQRVLLTCIAQVDSRPGVPPLTSDVRFVVRASDLAELTGTSLDQAYLDLTATVDRLYERSVVFDDPDPHEKWHRLKTRWISDIAYKPDSGEIRLTFAPGIIPYLTQLSREFTQYKLANVTRMTSTYAIRLYELLMQWQGTGKREIEIEWLKQQFMLEDKYQRIANLKLRVIDPAIAQINEHSNLWCKYTQRKTGRMVTHFKFEFGTKDAKHQRPENEKKMVAEAKKCFATCNGSCATRNIETATKSCVFCPKFKRSSGK